MFIDFKFFGSFFGNFINQFLLIATVAFIYMIVRGFAKIAIQQIFLEDIRGLWRSIKQIQLDDLIVPFWEGIMFLTAIFVFFKSMCDFEIITNDFLTRLFAHPEFLTGFAIATWGDHFVVDLPISASQKQKKGLASFFTLLFDALFAMYFIPFLAFGIIKLVKFSAALTTMIFGASTRAFVLNFGTRTVNTGVMLSAKAFILAFAALIGGLIPTPFSDGFFVLFPLMSTKVVVFLTELNTFGRILIRFTFILFFEGLLEMLLKGPLHKASLIDLYAFLINALY